jgi:hypothetical protein
MNYPTPAEPPKPVPQ